MPQEEKQHSSKKYNRNSLSNLLISTTFKLCLFNDLQHHVISSDLTPTIFVHGAALYFQYRTTTLSRCSNFLNILNGGSENCTINWKINFLQETVKNVVVERALQSKQPDRPRPDSICFHSQNRKGNGHF